MASNLSGRIPGCWWWQQSWVSRVLRPEPLGEYFTRGATAHLESPKTVEKHMGERTENSLPLERRSVPPTQRIRVAVQ